MSKYKIAIICLVTFIIGCIIVLIVIKKPVKDEPKPEEIIITEEDIIFKLNGSSEYDITDYSLYHELGFVALSKDGKDLSDYVTIEKDEVEDNYFNVHYYLNYNDIELSLTRKINIVLEDESEKENKLSINLVGEKELYILLGNEYKEFGAIAKDEIDGNISKNIIINHDIKTDEVGEYTVEYSITNSQNQTETISRKVVVYDYKYNIEKVKKDNKVEVTFSTTNNIMKYIVIDGKLNKVKNNKITISLEDNKEYNVKIFDIYDNIKEDILNFIKPIFTCAATISNSNTSVNVNTTNNNLKFIYYFNNQKYSSDKNNYNISGVFNNVLVEAFDENDNSNKVLCNVINNNPILESGLKKESYSGWNYYLYVPKNTRSNDKKPLIVFLHGSGERGTNYSLLERYGFARYIKNGQDYDAYILMPQLPKNKYWADEVSKTMELIKKIVKDYNIDQDRISLSGFSLGAIGIPSIMKSNQNYFSCVVMIAVGGNKKGYASYFKNIPVRFYTGSKDTRLGNSSDTKAFIAAVKKVNSNVESIVYKNQPHNVVALVLEDGKVAKWMIAQKKK